VQDTVKKYRTSLDNSRNPGSPIKSSSKLFGVPLSELMQRQKKGNLELLIPVFAHRVLESLSHRGINEEGIFRVSGNHMNVLSMRELLDQGEDIDLANLECHDIASIFKTWLRSLPESLLPASILTLTTCEDGDISSSDLDQLRNHLADLPLYNYELCRALFKMLVLISNHETVTRMSPSNLATTISPALINIPCDLDGLKMIRCANGIVTVIITHYDDIFPVNDQLEDNEIQKVSEEREKRAIN